MVEPLDVIVVMLIEGDAEWRLREMESLCTTAGYNVARVFTQKGRPRRRYIVREGKMDEIQRFVETNEIESVVFENFLSSSQVVAIEDLLKIPVMDRFDLILNVFELHAESKEAQLQIELARLKRRIPYLKMYLGRRVKSEHPGFGGSGEFIINSTLTGIHRRIKSIENSLERFEKRTELQRKRRKKIGFVVSLAGYTNVGKTTLLAALTGSEKAARDELFTTLRTKTASFEYKRKKFLLNDTIGFIRNLPYQLIYAFKATLMDIASSDLILIVHDCSIERDEFFMRKEICEETLSGIGADQARWMNVENKVDMGRKFLNDSVGVSGKTGEGLDELKQKVYGTLKDG